MSSKLYDQDFYDWSVATAELLRAGRVYEADLENIAEEIESLGRSLEHELESRTGQILEHLLKLRVAKGVVLDYNRRGWNLSILRQRQAITSLFKTSPSLRRKFTAELIADEYRHARELVALQFDITPPAECPWTVEEILQSSSS